MDMEFWGVEVKSGQSVKCDPGEQNCVHLSQVALGEIKKEKQNDIIPIYVKIDDKKIVIGSLSTEKCTQISLDLVFEKEFELSHSWKSGSVYFCGYKSTSIDEEDDDDDDSHSDSEEMIQEGLNLVVKSENGRPEVKTEQLKQATGKAKAVKPGTRTVQGKSNAELDVEDDDDNEDDEDDEDMVGSDESDDDEEDESDSSDGETPSKAPEKRKKRSQESATKTPGPEKKAKLVTPHCRKTGAKEGKKGGHVATPYPGKTQPKQTPNSAAKKSGQATCKTCSRPFKTEQALESHTKAKHSAAPK